jgi:hypothetical protein
MPERTPEQIEKLRAQWRAQAKRRWHSSLEFRRRKRQRYKQRNPQKVRELKRAQARRQRERDGETLRTYERKTQRRCRARKKRAKGNAIFQAANAAVPRTLPEHIRADVIAALALGVLERRFTINDLPAEAKREIAAHNRMFDRFKTVSLDAPMPGTDDMRRIDTIAADAMHF